MHPFDLYIPKTVEEALELLAATGGRPIAGGTDLIVFMQEGKIRPQVLIDLSRLDELRYIQEEDGLIRIGPLTTHAELARSPLLRERGEVLAQAAAVVGAPQIRNRGTIGGNIATASPAGDTIPALMALGAQVKLRSMGGQREVPLQDLFTGPGQTVIRGDELITEVAFPLPGDSARGAFLKLRKRNALAIAVVSAAVTVTLMEGVIGEAHIALGAVAPTVIRASAAEQVLRGREPSAELLAQAGELAAAASRPITDIRGSAAYRREMVKVLVRRGLAQVSHKCL
ncbi:MAG: FAD binding domain-containing protein [Anaerolineae bacterium]